MFIYIGGKRKDLQCLWPRLVTVSGEIVEMDECPSEETLPVLVPSQGLTQLVLISFSSYLNTHRRSALPVRQEMQWAYSVNLQNRALSHSQIRNVCKLVCLFRTFSNVLMSRKKVARFKTSARLLTFRFFCVDRTSQDLTPVANRPKKTSPLRASTNAVTAVSLILFLPDTSRERREGRT